MVRRILRLGFYRGTFRGVPCVFYCVESKMKERR
jgi:hypothetical protein